MANNNLVKYGLLIGGGIAIGAIGALVLTRNSEELKKAAATILSHGMDFKEKAAAYMETAKENMEDLAAEAKDMSDKRNA